VDVSVQFGIGSYTENHFNTDPLFNRRGYIDSVDAEVAVIDRNGRYVISDFCRHIGIDCHDDYQMSHVTPELLVVILVWAMQRRVGSRYGSNPVKY
jgi:hypothetical protein